MEYLPHILNLKSGNLNPNFTLVLPGPCQAACDFCNWKQDDKIGRFMTNLENIFISEPRILPSKFRQVSISGGEPTMSPVFGEVLEILNNAKRLGRIDKVVLTTNGFHLLNCIPGMVGTVDHVNISRHHHDDKINASTFNTLVTKLPDETDLKEIIKTLNKKGIDVNFNCVMNPRNDDFNLFELQSFIGFAKNVGATSIAFRNQYDNYKASELQEEVEENYLATTEQSCPVCITKTFTISGMKIKFHHSSNEPTESELFDKDETYELILHGNGKLTRDWEGVKEVSTEPQVQYFQAGTIPPSNCQPSPRYMSCTEKSMLEVARIKENDLLNQVKELSDKVKQVSRQTYVPPQQYSSCGQFRYSSC